jgi:phosphocarrier protein HPr
MNEPAGSSPQSTSDKPAPREGAVVGEFLIANKKGLHARASAKFVQTVEKFDADVRVRRKGDCGESVGGTSIMGLMMLAAAPGTTIMVEATGKGAAEVVAALGMLINSRFGEAD